MLSEGKENIAWFGEILTCNVGANIPMKTKDVQWLLNANSFLKKYSGIREIILSWVGLGWEKGMANWNLNKSIWPCFW